MHFVPIPYKDDLREYHNDLRRLSPHWLPFLEKISQRSKEPIDDLLDLIAKKEVQIGLVCDDTQAHALLGIRTVKRGDAVIGEIIWATGTGMKEWTHLLPELEQFLRDIGCSEIRPLCRPGWSRLLKQHGYRVTHYQMEKAL